MSSTESITTLYSEESKPEGSRDFNVEQDGHLSFSGLLSESDLDSIEKSMKEKFDKDDWGFYSGDFARFVENESAYLVNGTFRLMEKVVNSSIEGDPFTSVIFLDKSARPGSYLYRKMADLLTDKGFIPKDLVLPEVKFMDVGKTKEGNKVKSLVTAEFMRESLKPEFLGNHILIVDEFKDTGATLANGVEEFKDIYREYIPDLRVDSIYHFNVDQVAPFWYRDSSTKSLVSDALSIATENLRKLDQALQTIEHTDAGLDGSSKLVEDGLRGINTSYQEVKLLKNLSGRVSRDIFVEMFEIAQDGGGEERINKLIKETSPSLAVSSLEDEISAVANSKILIRPEDLYSYFKYAGGRLAAPYRGDRHEATSLREMMSTLVHLVADKISERTKGAKDKVF